MTQPALPSYSSGPSTLPLLGDTIGANLDRTAARVGEHEALVECATGRRWSYPQFVADVDAVALGLDPLGVATGDRVGIWSPNCAGWAFVQYGTAKLGAILVNINPAYRTHELAYVLKQAGISVLVSAPEFKTSDYRSMVAEVRGDCPDLREVVFLGDPQWTELMDVGRGRDRALLAERETQLSADDPINIQYTSGTTGFPKGATLTHHNLLNNGFFVGEGCGYTEADRVCIPVPYYHCFGMGMGNLGCTSHGPTMVIAELGLANFADYDLSSLRTGIMAGSPCPVEVMKRVVAEMGMAEVTICYGMTETSPVSTQTGADDDLDRRTSTVGRVHPHLEVMIGYGNEPDKTAEVIDAARWMHTGDLATMDAEGYLNIVGRIKDMVIRGGENVYPREIEEFLYTHPDVVDAQVIGVPDERYGEELMAWVRMPPGAEPLTAEALREFCQGKLAHYKVPRYVKIVEEFPMTVTGKIRKVEMRQVSVDELGLQSAAAVRNA